MTPLPSPEHAAPATAGAWSRFFAALTGRRVALALGAAVVVAIALNPIFSMTPFIALLGRTLFVAMVLLFAFTAAGEWPQQWLPDWLPRWVVQVLALAVAAPLATLTVYLLSVGGDIAEFLSHRGRIAGFLSISGSALAVGIVLGLGALYRERDAQARNQALAFALEKSTLECQVLDARLALLHSQIEPHFLFNTLANVQALVESSSPRAAPVLQSLIAYLRAAMPRLEGVRATLGDEATLVRAYLELMAMRMPDRLDFDVAIEPGLQSIAFPPMALLTLVENAVKHGIDPSEEGGRIEVRAGRSGERVHVVVADSGVGMDPSAAPGTGLSNLRERLAAFFGTDATLELHEQSPRGLRAELAFDVR